ncbi:MAG: phosphoribosylanthranilate isomerase [Prochlorococcaceae cyanobacterium]|jgi:phosphoribosylanthranilate isomerase
MHRPLLKICGLRSPGQAAAVAALGVDAIGVIAVPSSPRFLAPPQRSALFAAARRAHPGCEGVLVVADPGESQLGELEAEGHGVVQLHGGESLEFCRSLRRRLGEKVRIWKALRIRSREDLAAAEAYSEVVDALLLDAWVAGVLGGTGHAIPREWLAGFRPAVPWWLAGGISPESVQAVLQELRPDGLDASSGVERTPGDKDLERVRALVRQVKGKAQGSGANPALEGHDP